MSCWYLVEGLKSQNGVFTLVICNLTKTTLSSKLTKESFVALLFCSFYFDLTAYFFCDFSIISAFLLWKCES